MNYLNHTFASLLLCFSTIVLSSEPTATVSQASVTAPLSSINLLLLNDDYYGIDLSKAKKASDFGYDLNNATAALRAAFLSAEHPLILVDKQVGDWWVDPVYLKDVQNKTVVFERGVRVRARVGTFPARGNNRLFGLDKPVNLRMVGYGATLSMNKSEYTEGESRHAISISGGVNVSIEGFTIRDSGGDGIYLTGYREDDQNHSKNIRINNVVLDNHRRQGMSIISAEDVWVTNTTFKNTNGTLPEAGVDLEPNHSYQRLVNINFDGCRFVNNNHAGLTVASVNLEGSSSLPISLKVSNSYFSMNHDASNRYKAAEVVFGANRTDPVGGLVEFENVEFDGSDWGIFSTRMPSNAYRVSFKNIIANNLMQANAERGGIFTLEVPDYFNPSSLGNFEFENVNVNYSNTKPVFYVFDSRTLSGFFDINGSVAINNPAEPARLESLNNLEYSTTRVDIKATINGTEGLVFP